MRDNIKVNLGVEFKQEEKDEKGNAFPVRLTGDPYKYQGSDKSKMYKHELHKIQSQMNETYKSEKLAWMRASNLLPSLMM